MNLSTQIAKHLREVYFGGNWTSSNLKDNLADFTWQQAATQVYSFNTIAFLVYHMNYYVSAVLKVLQGELLEQRINIVLTIHQFNLKKTGKKCWIKPGLMQKTLPA